MIKTIVVLSAALITALLFAGCDLGSATPLPVSAEAASAPDKPVLSIPRLDRDDASRVYPRREPSDKERKGALLLLLLGGRR